MMAEPPASQRSRPQPGRLERATGFEPATKSLGSSYSTN